MHKLELNPWCITTDFLCYFAQNKESTRNEIAVSGTQISKSQTTTEINNINYSHSFSIAREIWLDRCSKHLILILTLQYLYNIPIIFWTFSCPIRRPTALKHTIRCFTTASQPFHWPQTPVWLYWTQNICCSGAKKNPAIVSWNGLCQHMYRLKMKKRKDGTVGKLRRLFVNSNNTNRGKRVALLQDKWSPAVGSSVCIKGKLCSALPPLPSARGSMSTFSLDPWRWLNTKLHTL